MNRVLVSLADGETQRSVASLLRAAGIEAAPTPAQSGWGPLVVIEDAPNDLAEVPGDAQGGGAWRLTPARVLVAPEGCAYSRAEAMLAGADDLAIWPRERDELVAKVTALIRRRTADMDAHPLTGLPGGAALQRALAERLPERGRLAVLGCDLRQFKALNDRYGFLRGDAVLGALADVLEAAAQSGETVHHLGGDDFFIITNPGRADALARQVIAQFDGIVPSFYDPADREAGFIVGLDRGSGAEVRFPPVALTVACATNEAADIVHPGQVAEVLAELKAFARRQPGSAYARDRRRIHAVAEALRARGKLDEGERAPPGEGDSTEVIA